MTKEKPPRKIAPKSKAKGLRKPLKGRARREPVRYEPDEEHPEIRKATNKSIEAGSRWFDAFGITSRKPASKEEQDAADAASEKASLDLQDAKWKFGNTYDRHRPSDYVYEGFKDDAAGLQWWRDMHVHGKYSGNARKPKKTLKKLLGRARDELRRL